MRLLSHEKKILCAFINASTSQRAVILADAKADPKTSGPLIQALRWAEQL